MMDLSKEMTAIHPIHAELKSRLQASKDAPIGIFDSGVGGLTIAQEIVQHLPMNRLFIMPILHMFLMGHAQIRKSDS